MGVSIFKAAEKSGDKANCDARQGIMVISRKIPSPKLSTRLKATQHTAKKGSETFAAKGNFNVQAFIKALHENGLDACVKLKFPSFISVKPRRLTVMLLLA